MKNNPLAWLAHGLNGALTLLSFVALVAFVAMLVL